MGLRMTEGISHKHWQLFSPELGLQEVMGTSADIQSLLQSGRLILDDRGLRCSWNGLALLDSILPTLLLELERKIPDQQKTHSEFPEEQTQKTCSPLS